MQAERRVSGKETQMSGAAGARGMGVKVVGLWAFWALLLVGLCGCTGVQSMLPVSTTAPHGADPVMPADLVRGPHAVIAVIDGDTISVERDDERVKVRLIGIDTPETQDRRTGVQCFGAEASEHAKQLLTGQSVYLEQDPSQDSRDQYGRELAYVWTTSGQLVNLMLISAGFGHEYTYDLPYRYQAQFRSAESDARANGRGFWSPATCNGDTGAG